MKHSVGQVASNPVVTIRTANTVREAQMQMRQAKIRHLPVLEDGKLVGMLSDRELQQIMPSGLEKPVGEFMTPATSVSSEALLRDVVEKMREAKVLAYAVVDKGHLIGILTTDDLLRVLISMLDSQERTFAGGLSGLKFNTTIGSLLNMLEQVGI